MGAEGVCVVAVVHIYRGLRIARTSSAVSRNAPIELSSEFGAVRVRDVGNRRMYKMEMVNGSGSAD